MNKPAAFIVVENGQTRLRTSAETEEAYQRGYAEAKLKLKREPLTGIEISNGFKADDVATHPLSYWAGVQYAEKMHGVNNEISTT